MSSPRLRRRKAALLSVLLAALGGFVAAALARQGPPPPPTGTAGAGAGQVDTTADAGTSVPPATTGPLRRALDAWATAMPPAGCALVVDEGGEVLLDLRSEVPVVPASTLKLLTATAALLADPGGVVDPAVLGRLLADSDADAAATVAESLGGVAEIGTVLARAGVDLDDTVIADASGHSGRNRVTCRLLVGLLARPVTGPVLESALAVAGRSGTLSDRFVGTSLDGVLRAKTGSLSSVSALAGVVRSPAAAFRFAVVVNAMPPDRVDPQEALALQQRLGELLVAWPDVAPGADPSP